MLLIYPSIIHDNERLELQVSFRQHGIMGRGSSSMGKGEGSSFSATVSSMGANHWHGGVYRCIYTVGFQIAMFLLMLL